MSEPVIREHEARTRVNESWWVVDGIQSWSGGSEEAARDYQRKHGGSIQVTRLTETTYGYTALVSCPTCQGPSRETVGMVCQTCRTDYGVSRPVLRHYLSEVVSQETA